MRLNAGLALLIAMGGIAAAADQGPIYELRTYTVHPGRLPALEARFRDHTMRIFEKHGMANVGYWIPIDQPDTLIYIISHPSREAARAGWKAFGADPEWHEVARNSRKDGPILVQGGVESVFMRAAGYSPIP